MSFKHSFDQQMQTLHQSIQNISELLYRKISGAEECFKQAIKQFPDQPIVRILGCIIVFFSFSKKAIDNEFPVHMSILNNAQLAEKEARYYQALQAIASFDFPTAFSYFARLAKLYPTDQLNILMLQAMGFLGGFYEKLTPIYEDLIKVEKNKADPDFLGAVAFLYCHTNRLQEAKGLVLSALRMAPNNAWVQHVYAHTLNETNTLERKNGIKFMLKCHQDWPKQSRFFEGHNWAHTCILMLHEDEPFANIQDYYNRHIWGEAKTFNFEQNNAFLVLWNAELLGHQVPQVLWDDLATHACAFIEDYFTPYLTITAILTVAKSGLHQKRLQQATTAFETYAQSLLPGSFQRAVWHNTALPILQGMLAYSLGNPAIMQKQPAELYQESCTKLLGHSIEQRSIFLATYQQLQLALAN